MPVNFNRGAGATAAQLEAWGQALNYLSKYPGMVEILNAMADPNTNLTINFFYDGNDSYIPSTNSISWDPTSALNVVQANGQVSAQSAALGLFHELCHWLYAHTGNAIYAEESATYIEGQAALALGEAIRPSYNTVSAIYGYVVVTNPTAHTAGGYWQAVDLNGNPVQGPAYNPNETRVTVPGGPTGSSGSTGGSAGTGGGEHNGSGSGGSGVGSVGAGGGGVGGGGSYGGSGGGHWQVPPHLETPDPYDAPIVPEDHSITTVGTAELQFT
jgi:hypothetical protein